MNEYTKYEKNIDLNQIIGILLKKLKYIICLSILTAIILAGIRIITIDTSSMTLIKYKEVTDYLSSAKIYVGNGISPQTAEAVRTYLLGNEIAQNVNKDLSIDLDYNTYKNMVNLSNSTDYIITINVIGDNEQQISNIANSIASIGTQKIIEKFKLDEAMLLEPAFTTLRNYTIEVTTNDIDYKKILVEIIKYGLGGLFLGIFASSFVFIYKFILDKTIKDEKDVKGYLNLSVIGTMPVISEGKHGKSDKKYYPKKNRLNQYQ